MCIATVWKDASKELQSGTAQAWVWETPDMVLLGCSNSLVICGEGP
jgi:hypothetical protein